MLIEKSKAIDNMASSVIGNGGASENLKGGGVFEVTCLDQDGNVKWSTQSHNLVVNVGLQNMRTQYFAGSSYTAAWYLGLYGATLTLFETYVMESPIAMTYDTWPG